jgi:predicted ATPase
MSSPFHQQPARIVVTGGPGAGKTAVLELARRDLCRHVEVLPESASIVFRGGFPRRKGESERRCAQRAIYRVQAELERMMLLNHRPNEGDEGNDNDNVVEVGLCDRGTLDTLAYWPGAWSDFFHELGTTMEQELARYAMVIHLAVPEDPSSYRQSEIRCETHREAQAIDARLFEVWASHPNRVRIDGTEDFLVKAKHALAALRSGIPRHDCDGGSARR